MLHLFECSNYRPFKANGSLFFLNCTSLTFESDREMTRREEALDYHSQGRPGKIEVVPTKPTNSQRDLSMAYSPGVAEPCLEIAADPELARKYTAKGNLVAVISNGTAVLG